VKKLLKGDRFIEFFENLFFLIVVKIWLIPVFINPFLEERTKIASRLIKKNRRLKEVA